MKMQICDMFGFEYPTIAFGHCRDVVAAVTKVSGLGVLGAAGHSPQSKWTSISGGCATRSATFPSVWM